MKVLLGLVWVGVIISAVLGVLVIVGGMSAAQGAPQEAVVVALGMAFAVIPYVAARGIEGISKLGKKEL